MKNEIDSVIVFSDISISAAAAAIVITVSEQYI